MAVGQRFSRARPYGTGQRIVAAEMGGAKIFSMVFSLN
jgi:hypothetical protein